MNAIVDTNVAAYYLLGTEGFVDECRDFWQRTAQVWAPSLWQAEIVNVLWMAVRQRVITPEDSAARLRLAAALGIQSVPVRQLWRGALIRAIGSGISGYDTLFVELAARRRLHLATFDSHLLRTFPEIARRPSQCI